MTVLSVLHPSGSSLIRCFEVQTHRNLQGERHVGCSRLPRSSGTCGSRLLGIQAVRDVTQEIPAATLVNNMRRDFLVIQNHASAILSERAGEPVDWTLGTMHDLRKSYATLMARRVPMYELQKLMGHASITTTAEYYTEASQDVTDAVELVFAS